MLISADGWFKFSSECCFNPDLTADLNCDSMQDPMQIPLQVWLLVRSIPVGIFHCQFRPLAPRCGVVDVLSGIFEGAREKDEENVDARKGPDRNNSA